MIPPRRPRLAARGKGSPTHLPASPLPEGASAKPRAPPGKLAAGRSLVLGCSPTRGCGRRREAAAWQMATTGRMAALVAGWRSCAAPACQRPEARAADGLGGASLVAPLSSYWRAPSACGGGTRRVVADGVVVQRWLRPVSGPDLGPPKGRALHLRQPRGRPDPPLPGVRAVACMVLVACFAGSQPGIMVDLGLG